jgi:hypothetical protein
MLFVMSYSRDEIFAAVRVYYHLLTQIYLDESRIIEHPPGGWPDINLSAMHSLNKTDKVINQMCYLPYIRRTDHEDSMQIAPYVGPSDWIELAVETN